MQKLWARSQDVYYNRDASDNIKLLPFGVYIPQIDMNGIMYLQKIEEAFTFSYKIYGKDEKFIKRMCRTYDETTGNLGILLNGVKGTGKTVTAKMLCNELGLPVILVNKNLGEGFVHKLSEFVSGIQQNIVMFFDEFEKIFPNEGWGKTPSLLTLMDGVYNGNHRKVFLMTTNEMNLNENYLERPSRIRYIKKYDDLELETIEELVDDILVHKELRAETIEFISRLNIITIDIVKSILSEVNIHGEAPQEFEDIFNVQETRASVDIYVINGETETLYISGIEQNKVYPVGTMTSKNLGQDFRIAGKLQGDITAVFEDGSFHVQFEDKNDKTVIQKYKIVLNKKKHRSFYNALAF